MQIRKIICAALALSMLSSTAAFARWDADDRSDNRNWEQHRNARSAEEHHDAVVARRHWNRGDHLPREYWGHNRYEVVNWKSRHWRAPPRGYHYVQTDDGDVVLAAIATGVIASIILNAQN